MQEPGEAPCAAWPAPQDALLGMHREPGGWGGEAPAGDVTETSAYMRALVRHITHCRWGAGGRA